MKTLKGWGWYLPVSPDGRFLITFGQKKFFVHSLPDLKTETFKTPFSNAVAAAMSHNGKLIAVKNTSGKIAVMEYPSGEILGVCPMEKTEGYDSICFSPDDSYILDFDRNHEHKFNIMKLGVSGLKHEVLYRGAGFFPAHFAYDESKNRLFFIASLYMYTSPLENIAFEKRELGLKHGAGLPQSVFAGKNYGAVIDGAEIALFDADWNTAGRFAPKFNNAMMSLSVSDNGKMLYIRYLDRAYLYETSCPDPVLEWVGLTLAGARFINNDTMIAVGGWSGTIVEKLK